jgi:zinc protease
MKHFGTTNFFFLTAGMLLVLLATGRAQDTYKPDQLLTPDPKILIGKLDNGLTYYIRENKKPEKRAELRLAVRAGSILEDNDQQGLAHFVEHMAFNGTKDFPKQSIIDFLEKSGVQFGPDLNAYTSFDETVYMMQVPTDSPEVLKKGFQILKEWAHDVTFDTTEINKERGVIVEEWRLGRGANWRIMMKHLPYELYKSRYADRLPIGKKEIIESCPPSAITRFYHDWYRPDLMAVLAVGDFDKTEIEKIIKQNFAGLKNPPNERKRPEYPIPDNSQTLVSIAPDPELTRTSVEMIFKRDEHVSRTVGDYRNDVKGYLYDGMLNDRLQELLQKPDPPFIYAYSGDGRFIGNKQAYTLGAAVKENSILGGFDAVLKEAFRVKDHGFTATELARQKISILRWMEENYRERDKTESRQLIDEYLRNFLIHEPIPGIEVEYNLYKEYLPGISLDEVDRLSAVRMTAGNRVITISAPEKATVKLPTDEEVLAVVNRVSEERLKPYVDKISSEPLVSGLPATGTIAEEKKIPSLGVTEWKLSNGARVVLKPTDFKNDEILFSAYSNGGTSLVADSDYLSALYATSIVEQSGVDNFDLIELEKKLAGKVVSVNPSIGKLGEGFNGSTTPRDLETLFQLIYLYATEPRRDTASFASLMDRQRASLENRNVSPERAYYDTIQVTLADYNYRARPITLQLLPEIKLDRALAIYKDRFADFSDFTFFFVGSFALDTIKPLVEQYLATLPSLHRNETWRDLGIEPPKGVISKEVDRGIEPKSKVNMTFTGPFVWSQKNRYVFNSMLEALTIKLREVLREDKGGTYGVGVYGAPSLFPRQEYSVTISWTCSPKRVDELVQTALLQIDSLKIKPLDTLYIEKVSEIQRRSFEVNLKRNGFWLANLQAYYTNGENPEMILNYPTLVDHLSAGEIREAVKEYINTKNYVKVVLYPEKKVE